jgi:protein tyrosine phosphatase (PTP) superfamily phosphohydrolase (DUF442 family)
MDVTIRIAFFATLLPLATGGAASGLEPALEAPNLEAPNVVAVSPVLVTSGQPSAEALAGLGEGGFEAVIYLAPSTVSDAVADEPRILESQGIRFVHIPIPFDAPTEAHVASFSDALSRLADKRVLVHCQINLRASSMVFLYRTIVGNEPPDIAYEAVAEVWSPEGPWRTLIITQLRKHGIDFEPY